MQYAIVMGDLETYNLLKARGADPAIRTPVFGVHILHFAAALLRTGLLKGIGTPLSKASTTAMCHSLLHVAALSFQPERLREFCSESGAIYPRREMNGRKFQDP